MIDVSSSTLEEVVILFFLVLLSSEMGERLVFGLFFCFFCLPFFFFLSFYGSFGFSPKSVYVSTVAVGLSSSDLCPSTGT